MLSAESLRDLPHHLRQRPECWHGLFLHADAGRFHDYLQRSDEILLLIRCKIGFMCCQVLFNPTETLTGSCFLEFTKMLRKVHDAWLWGKWIEDVKDVFPSDVMMQTISWVRTSWVMNVRISQSLDSSLWCHPVTDSLQCGSGPGQSEPLGLLL